MATIIIPTRGDIANYSQLVTLDGTVFRLTFRYNSRDEAWYFSVHTEAGVPVREGMKLIPNYVLMRLLAPTENTPAGKFVLVDTRALPIPPVMDELGDVVQFTYTEADA